MEILKQEDLPTILGEKFKKFQERVRRAHQGNLNLIEDVLSTIKPDNAKLASLIVKENNPLTPAEEIASVIEIAICTSPFNLGLAQCTHRAVVACLGKPIRDLNSETRIELEAFCAKPNNFTYLVDIGNETFLFVMGYNHWFGVTDQPLNCKIVLGEPTNRTHLGVETTDLPWKKDFSPLTLDNCDTACPKRLHQLPCNIVHAEAHTFEKYQAIKNKFNLQTNAGTLSCTWVPCNKCLSKIESLKHELKGVFSCYFTDDDEDRRNASWISENLSQEALQGPFSFIPKVHGYGWIVANEIFLRIIGKVKSETSKTIRDFNIYEKLMELGLSKDEAETRTYNIRVSTLLYLRALMAVVKITQDVRDRNTLEDKQIITDYLNLMFPDFK